MGPDQVSLPVNGKWCAGQQVTLSGAASSEILYASGPRNAIIAEVQMKCTEGLSTYVVASLDSACTVYIGCLSSPDYYGTWQPLSGMALNSCVRHSEHSALDLDRREVPAGSEVVVKVSAANFTGPGKIVPMVIVEPQEHPAGDDVVKLPYQGD